ncbi:MAG: hypothetical protein M3N93_03545 [Acidobacteriota bacterium]|nr:hypothetical protein [Acidobacteriota bacterium]
MQCAVAADDHSDRLARDYTYKIRNEIFEFDGKGKAKTVHSTLDEVLYIGGRRHFDPLEKDGNPIPEAQQRKEQAKLDRAAREASRMTDAQRAKRLRESEKERASRRADFKDIPDAFDFALAGEDEIGGRAAYRIRATPRPVYRGKLHAILNNIEGTLWIDKRDSIWVRFEADVLKPFYVGWFLARVGQGTHISYEMTRLDDDLWAPGQISLTGSARFALLKKVNVAQKVTFSDYRKFQTDSRILAGPGSP